MEEQNVQYVQEAQPEKKKSKAPVIIIVVVVVVLILGMLCCCGSLLTGIFAPQYVRYVNKSQIASDEATATAIASCVKMIAAEPEYYENNDMTGSIQVAVDGSGNVTIYSTGCYDTDKFRDDLQDMIHSAGCEWESDVYKNNGYSFYYVMTQGDYDYTEYRPE